MFPEWPSPLIFCIKADQEADGLPQLPVLKFEEIGLFDKDMNMLIFILTQHFII